MKEDLKWENKGVSQSGSFANSFVMSERDASSPYVSSFIASRNLRVEQQQARASFKRDGYDPLESGYGAGDARTRTMPKEKRGVLLAIIMLILVVAYVAVAALSFFAVLPEYSAVYAVSEAVEDEEEAIEPTYIQNRDIIMGFIKSFNPEMEEESVFYNECMAEMEDIGIVNKIAYYALPISLAAGVVLAVLLIIFLLVYVAKAKGRGAVLGLSILLFVLNILFVFGGFVWSVGSLNFAEIIKFIPFYNGEDPLSMVMHYGTLASLGISLIILLFSVVFMIRSKKNLRY